MVAKKLIFTVFLKGLLYLVLFILFVYFFLKDQLGAFTKHRTTITTRGEIAQNLEFPTVTFCFDPRSKQTFAKNVGLSNSIYDIYKISNPNLTIIETFDKISYNLHKDFDLINFQRSKFLENSFDSLNGRNLTYGPQLLSECYRDNVEMKFNLQPIRTNLGTCYKFSPEFSVTLSPVRFCWRIILNSDLKDKPEWIRMFITSNNSWYGILDSGAWPLFKPLHQLIHFKKDYTIFLVKVQENMFKDEDVFDEHCFKKYFGQRNCSKICHIMSYPGIPSCSTDEELKCIRRNEWNYKSYFKCFKSKYLTNYILQDRYTLSTYNDPNMLSTDIYVGVPTMKKVIHEEVELITFQDLIGSIGGSLGLFFGFSFTTIILLFINKISNSYLINSN